MLKQNLSQRLLRGIGRNHFRFLMAIVFSAATVSLACFALISRAPVIRATSEETIIPSASKTGFFQERVEAELITIRPTGFEPEEITRAEGRFILAVDNRSGLEEVDLRLNFQTGRSEREVLVHRKQLDWHDFVDLSPGRYVLKEANHPDWACLVTITGE